MVGIEAPTQRHVIAAIMAASHLTGADPVKVERGEGISGNVPDEGRQLTRARAYAALALRAVFEGFDTFEIARLCGASKVGQYFDSLDHRMKRNALGWWDDEVFMAVIGAIEAVPAEEASGETAV